MCTTREKNEVTNEVLYRRFADNLRILMNKNDMNITQLSRMLGYKQKITMDRTALSKNLSSTENKKFELCFVVACAEYFQVPVDALLSENIEVYNSRQTNVIGFQKIIDLPELVEQIGKREDIGPMFITDPSSHFLKKYCQKYYCYYYSTVSEENKGEDPIIRGELKIYPRGKDCAVELVIDTKSFNDDGEVNYKRYLGTAVMSSTTLAVHCSLREENIGEYCYVIFRYSHVNYAKQDCRMAMILSTASTPDKRDPVVHRMFMSKEEIQPEDIKIIAPHLCLNSSKITISEKEMLCLQELSLIHKEAIAELLEADPELVYVFKESAIKDVAEKYFDKAERDSFLSEIRNASVAYRNNKVSQKVDENVRNVLCNAGYYKKNKE